MGTSITSGCLGSRAPTSSAGLLGWVPSRSSCRVTSKAALNPLTVCLLHYFHKNNCPELDFSRVGSSRLVVRAEEVNSD